MIAGIYGYHPALKHKTDGRRINNNGDCRAAHRLHFFDADSRTDQFSDLMSFN
jgi:hypothetical protein